MVGTLVVVYGWYLTSVIDQLDGSPVADVGYETTAVMASIAVVVLSAVSHIVLAVTGSAGSRSNQTGATAIKRYARSHGAAVVAAASVLGMVLAMVEADHFWIANVILAGLVIAEVTSAGSEILLYRRGA